MNKRILFNASIILIVLILITFKFVIDLQYKKNLNETFNTKVNQIEVLKRENGLISRDLTIEDEGQLKQFVQKLNIDTWSPKYIDLNSYIFRDRVIINKNIEICFTVDSDNSYICLIRGKYYHIPKDTYLYIKDYH